MGGLGIRPWRRPVCSTAADWPFVRGRLERGRLERGRLERGRLERGQLDTALCWSAAVRGWVPEHGSLAARKSKMLNMYSLSSQYFGRIGLAFPGPKLSLLNQYESTVRPQMIQTLSQLQSRTRIHSEQLNSKLQTRKIKKKNLTWSSTEVPSLLSSTVTGATSPRRTATIVPKTAMSPCSAYQKRSESGARLIRLGSGPPSPPPGPRNSLKGGHCSSSREPLVSGPYFDPSAFGDFAARVSALKEVPPPAGSGSGPGSGSGVIKA
ncbi:hypothetical protein BCR41DRAFT_402149 [Lobosporangium transversale]|uniref:Uncharacterized protein n=1 Tax=Lobosporangium transversale TaxID=64571 RepID=A0A1Y2G9Y8_9FUNG|nr:hypothetical protein BCR41DRAFT_402149 [Lobosporangium transversale]ORY96116.1 hypothetical protein BCR41DRAFT_402149 [Lobosporangium transversale]|eukprot:XP_021875535.1 hypothetical protein BCR41DRAFT_402149 [Lobosporangium transversale]